jgi:hypothetical protein
MTKLGRVIETIDTAEPRLLMGRAPEYCECSGSGHTGGE